MKADQKIISLSKIKHKLIIEIDTDQTPRTYESTTATEGTITKHRYITAPTLKEAVRIAKEKDWER